MIRSLRIVRGYGIALFVSAFPALVTTSALASASDDRAKILATLRSFVESDKERIGLWPDATLRNTNGPKRLWREVPNSQLNTRSRIERYRISVHGDRATAYVAASYRLYAGLDYTGESGLIYDYHVLHRRQGEWGISSTARRGIKVTNMKRSAR